MPTLHHLRLILALTLTVKLTLMLSLHPLCLTLTLAPTLSLLTNENMLGQCFRCRPSGEDPRISPLTPPYECPRQSLLIITSCSENQQNRTEVLFHYSMHHCAGESPALNTPIFSK